MKTEHLTRMPRNRIVSMLCVCIGLYAVTGEINAEESYQGQATQLNKHYSFSEIAIESVTGDVYSAEAAEKWQDLSYSDFFSKGWDKPWISPPNGGGGAPRQGWLNAYEGVFYRLGIAVFGWQHDFGNSGDGYSGNLVNFTPINQRFEIQTDISMVSNSAASTSNPQTNFGDFKITPRFMLSESKNLTQTFNITFRTPTGNSNNLAQNIAAITPDYQFWANWWKGLVVRGGAGFFIPYGGDLNGSGARSLFNANLAVGYYFTPHDFTPIGDMVWYVSTNLSQPIDNRAETSHTFVSLTPGFRTHMGGDWYLLGAVEVPVTNPEPFDYQVLGGIMKVF
ncbi:hypothetical protein [Methylomonas sp. MgM2]